jgi:hypothetical protein
MAVGFGPGDTIHHFSRTNSPRISIVLLPTAEKCWGVRGVGVSRGPVSDGACGHGPVPPTPIDRGLPSKADRRGVEPRVDWGPGGRAACGRAVTTGRLLRDGSGPARRPRPGCRHAPPSPRRFLHLYNRGPPTKSSVFFPESFQGVRSAGRGAGLSLSHNDSTRPAPKDSQACWRRAGGLPCAGSAAEGQTPSSRRLRLAGSAGPADSLVRATKPKEAVLRVRSSGCAEPPSVPFVAGNGDEITARSRRQPSDGSRASQRWVWE